MGELRPGDTVERYVVEARLGEGGMATVFLVRHSTLGTRHALKVLHADSPKVRERMIQEGRLQASLRHPNVVPVTDVLDAGGELALLVDYVAGGSLDDRIRARSPLPFAEVEALFRGIVAGVAHAHAHGLVHRDLKPANVLMDGEVPRVADFGLAKSVGETGATRTGAGLGTPAYMPPEQLRDARGVDARADLYALGAVLYELLTGARAFPSPDVLETFNAAAAGRFRPLAELRAGVPAPLANAVDATLRPRPDDRPADCAALLAILDGGPPPPRPADTWAASWEGAVPLDPARSGGSDGISVGAPTGSWAGAPPAEAPAARASPLPAALRSAPRPPESWPSLPSFHPPAPAGAPPLPGLPAPAPLAAPPDRGRSWRTGVDLALVALPVAATFLGLTALPDAIVAWHLPGRSLPPAATVIVAMPDVGPAARAEEAVLVDALVAHRARAIVFPQTFEAASPADDALRAALDRAEAAGVRVVTAADSPAARDASPISAGRAAGLHAYDPLTLRVAMWREGTLDEFWHLAAEALAVHRAPEAVDGWLLVDGVPAAPVDGHGRLRLRPWPAPPRLDPARVAAWTDDAIAGKVAVVGQTGGLAGRAMTPYGTRTTPEIAAGVIENLLNRQATDPSPLAQILATAAAGFGAASARLRFRRAIAALVPLGVIGLVSAVGDPLDLPWLPVLLAGALGVRVRWPDGPEPA